MDFLQRQQMMFTEEEQRKITSMVVLIAGTGGLGTHQALELQRIGVKKMYLIDSDCIEATNLNRQVLYGSGDIGHSKAMRAKEVLDSFQLGTEIIALQETIESTTIIPDDVQIIFDALDNLESRFDLEKLAQQYNLPIIHGGVHSSSGQITTIIPGQTQGFKEIFGQRTSHSTEIIPSFSPTVALIATLQVVEGVKIILNQPDNLVNRMLLIDLQDYSFQLMVCPQKIF